MLVKQEVKEYDGSAKVSVNKSLGLHCGAHWHDDCELILIESGCARFDVGEESFRAESGDAFFIGSALPHGVRFTDGNGCTATTISFDSALVRDLFKDRRLISARLHETYDLAAAAKELQHELQAKNPYYEFAVASRIWRIMIAVLRSEPTCEAAKEKAEEITFNGLLAEIDKKFEYFTFEDAADYMGLNPTYFSSLFHKSMGMTFSQYLNCVRVEKAVEQLKKPGVRITDVAMNCGFNTIRNFNRVFRLVTGCTPKQMPKDFVYESGYIRVASQTFARA